MSRRLLSVSRTVKRFFDSLPICCSSNVTRISLIGCLRDFEFMGRVLKLKTSQSDEVIQELGVSHTCPVQVSSLLQNMLHLKQKIPFQRRFFNFQTISGELDKNEI